MSSIFSPESYLFFDVSLQLFEGRKMEVFSSLSPDFSVAEPMRRFEPGEADDKMLEDLKSGGILQSDDEPLHVALLHMS